MIEQYCKVAQCTHNNNNLVISNENGLWDAFVERNTTPQAEKKPVEFDNVNHPKHYQGNGLEVIDVIEKFDLNYRLGNAIKYILRAGKKNATQEDLKKAIWYLQRELSSLKGQL